MSADIEQKVNDVLRKTGAQNDLGKGLGATEMMAAATQTFDDCNEFGSVGIPWVWVNCKIVEPETTDELTYNNDGEICFTGPTLMLGYYNNDEATNAIVRTHPDGMRWLHTGDVGHITEDGVIYVTGRIKRMIMTRGRDGQVTKLFPDRIEKAIYCHQLVESCCVIGVADKERIHYPKAFAVLEDKSDAAQAKREILEICKKTLPEYMVPDEIEIIDDMPRTPRGKIDYRALENM